MIPPELREWTPADPPASLLKVPRWGRRWRTYLVDQGYDPEGPELGEVLDGREGQPDDPGLKVYVAGRLAARGELPADQRAAAVLGAVREYLAAHPPAAALLLEVGPVSVLSPKGLGDRLARDGARGVRVDVLTGARWRVQRLTAEHAGHLVAGAALYRLAGVAAPEARLVRLSGRLAAAWPEPTAWERLAPAAAGERYGDEMAGELPADAWLGNRRILQGLRFRRYRLGGIFAPTARLDLVGLLGFTARGTRDSNFSRKGGARVDLNRLHRAPARSDLGRLYAQARARPELMAKTAAAIAGLAESKIAQAVALAALPTAAAAALVAVLVARRALLLSELQDRGVELPAGG